MTKAPEHTYITDVVRQHYRNKAHAAEAGVQLKDPRPFTRKELETYMEVRPNVSRHHANPPRRNGAAYVYK